MKSERLKPTASELALIVASLHRHADDDLDELSRTAIRLWELSEKKLEELQRFENEVSRSWKDWYLIDADENRKQAWLSGNRMLSENLRGETEERVRIGQMESNWLGAQGPPGKHSFNLSSVAEKILPQKNFTDRTRAAVRFLDLEIASLPSDSGIRKWLQETGTGQTKETEAWWIWVELLVRWQKQEGRFRQGNRWHENLRHRRLENQPPKKTQKKY